jgi:hypothetical protein
VLVFPNEAQPISSQYCSVAGVPHTFSLHGGSRPASLCDPNWLAVGHGNNRILLVLKIGGDVAGGDVVGGAVVGGAVRTCAGEKVLQVTDKLVKGFHKCGVATVHPRWKLFRMSAV